MDLDTLESISKLRGLVISEENVLYRAPKSKPSPTSQIITNTPGSQIIVTVCSASDPKTRSCDRDTKGSQGVGRDTNSGNVYTGRGNTKYQSPEWETLNKIQPVKKQVRFRVSLLTDSKRY